MAEEKFPQRDELLQVAMRVPKLDTAKHDAQAVDSWTLEGPFPAEANVTLVKPSTPWELELAHAVPAVGHALSFDQQFIRRFVEEAKTTVALSHPNIVPVYELGVEQGTYFLAMELV